MQTYMSYADVLFQRPQRRTPSTTCAFGSCRTHNAKANPKEAVYAELANNSAFFPQHCPSAERFVSCLIAPLPALPLFLRRKTLRSTPSQGALPTIFRGFGESPWKALILTDTEELPINAATMGSYEKSSDDTGCSTV